MRWIRDPRQTRLLDPFEGVLSELARERMLSGWQCVFRAVVWELLPVKELAEHFSPDTGCPTKELMREKGMSPIFRIRLLDLSPFLLPLSYLKPSLVTELSVTLSDGSPLPSEIGMDDKLVVLIRFRSTDQIPVPQDSAYFYVLNENQHNSDKIDIIVVYRQFPTGEGSPVSFMAKEKGMGVNVAPPPPTRGAPYQQWCA